MYGERPEEIFDLERKAPRGGVYFAKECARIFKMVLFMNESEPLGHSAHCTELA